MDHLFPSDGNLIEQAVSFEHVDRSWQNLHVPVVVVSTGSDGKDVVDVHLNSQTLLHPNTHLKNAHNSFVIVIIRNTSPRSHFR